jgi:Zn-dependent M28 family amino/carboxypeptidase
MTTRTLSIISTLFLFSALLHAEDAKKVTVDKERLIKTVRFLSEENFPCTAHPENKKKTIDYITKAITAAGLEATRDEFTVVFQEGTFTNVHALKKGKTGKRIIIGAHYDAVPESPGADDNASGVAVLIELAHMLKEAKLNCDVEFACYDIEEWGLWGSLHHAKKHKSQKTEIACMLCLDMVGYFSDEEGSQDYPLSNMHSFYGTKGNFLAVVGRAKDDKLVADVKKAFQDTVPLKAETFLVPQMLGFLFTVSDHAPFWQQGYPALLFTDTAGFRNKHYHEETDTWDTLDYDKMSQVAIGLYHVVLTLDAAQAEK